MPLFECQFSKEVTEKSCREYDAITKMRRMVPAVTFDKAIRTINLGIDLLIEEGATSSRKVTWARVASLFGEGSKIPHADLAHLWGMIAKVFGREKDSDLRKKYERLAMGGLLRWQMTLRPEKWVTDRVDKNRYDAFTGKEIHYAVYWIDENFVAYNAKKKSANSLSDLSQKFASLG